MRWVWAAVMLLLAGQGRAYERLPCGDVVHISTGETKTLAWDMPVPGENVTHTLVTWYEFIHNVRYPEITVPLPSLDSSEVVYDAVPPRSGAFYIEVRFVNAQGLISDFTVSSMDAAVQVPDPWCYIVKPAAPGGWE